MQPMSGGGTLSELRESAHQAFDGAYLTAIAINVAWLATVAVMAWRARAAPRLRLLPVTPP
jgi:hypothetical protein